MLIYFLFVGLAILFLLYADIKRSRKRDQTDAEYFRKTFGNGRRQSF